MIDFSDSEMMGNIRSMVHWFAENEVRPIALEADRAHTVPLEFLKKVKEAGVSMGPLPKELGAEGSDLGEKKDKKGAKQGNRVSALAAE